MINHLDERKADPVFRGRLRRFLATVVRRRGYAVDDEENSLGARCLGAPIFDAMGNVTAALGASGTLTQMDEDGMPRIIDALKETARRISRQLQRSGSAGAA